MDFKLLQPHTLGIISLQSETTYLQVARKKNAIRNLSLTLTSW